MIKWFVDKESRVPLYLQLRDLIRYYISTGAIQYKQQLPTVNGLAKELGINFETIRKAYKELEKEGLLSTRRGRGTFASGHANSKPVVRQEGDPKSALIESAKHAIRQLLQTGAGLQEIRNIFEQYFNELSTEGANQFIVFAECNQLQTEEISEILKNHLNLSIKPMLIKNLKGEVERIVQEGGKLAAVITTGFHINEVRNALGEIPVPIDFVITNMSPETRRELDAFPKTSRFGFICRDPESVQFYKEMLKTELAIETDIASCLFKEELKVKNLIKSVDVLLVSPSVFEAVKLLVPPNVPVFNVLDRVDPMSLKVIKDRILEAA